MHYVQELFATVAALYLVYLCVYYILVTRVSAVESMLSWLRPVEVG